MPKRGVLENWASNAFSHSAMDSVQHLAQQSTAVLGIHKGTQFHDPGGANGWGTRLGTGDALKVGRGQLVCGLHANDMGQQHSTAQPSRSLPIHARHKMISSHNL